MFQHPTPPETNQHTRDTAAAHPDPTAPKPATLGPQDPLVHHPRVRQAVAAHLRATATGTHVGTHLRAGVVQEGFSPSVPACQPAFNS